MPKQRIAPFLKWAGGKSQLLTLLSKIITKKSLTYYEPFLGGGSVFFNFAEHRRFQRAVLNDVNSELINCYNVVKDDLKALLHCLDAHKKNSDWNTQGYFTKIRNKEFTDPIERAARIIYLNKVCFNGLFRVNQSGKFNTPFGKYPNPSLYNKTNIEACSEALQRFATLQVGDFSDAVKDAQAGDLVYFDPPYVPLSETSNFTSYASLEFGVAQHKKLATVFRELFDRGVIVIQSNSDTLFVHELYEGFDMHKVKAKRSINSKGKQRGKVNEVVIVGQPKNLKVDVPANSYLPDVYPMECPKCGNIYSSSNILCPQCGTY